MPKQHIIYIISHVNKSLGLEWTLSELKKKYELTVLLLNIENSSFEDFLTKNKINVIRIYYNGKQNIVTAFIKVFWFFLKLKPDIIHTHVFDANLIALTAGRLCGIKKRIYTRHDSTYHRRYFPKGVKYDLWCNKMATHIISISQATYKTLVEFENVNPEKIRTIYHGFDLRHFDSIDIKNSNKIKLKWNIPDNHPRIGVIARYIEWKGIQYIIPAFKDFLKKYPDATLILANAYGPYHNQIVQQLETIPESNYRIIPFEEDVAALYKLFDIYIHTPIDSLCEAFGQTYIEALAAGVPSVFTLSGIACEFIEHEKNALVVNFKNSNEIYKEMIRLQSDKDLANTIALNGKQFVQKFNLERMINDLEKLYNE
ncbi:MAG: glycosyltransferase family 4 protein [Bacteroidetes bacterium]|nr:glycosyltransferase family 4 protein [Bacteroidota bacterium]